MPVSINVWVSRKLFSGRARSFVKSSLRYFVRVAFGLPSALPVIGQCAFFRLRGLRSICIPRSVAQIGFKCFESCPVLSTVSFESDSHLASIGRSAFDRCESLTAIWLPRSIKRICDDCFALCSRLCEVAFEADSALTLSSSRSSRHAPH
jgi:hypothetical protein